MAYLIGEYRQKVDAKGRLAVPASFRKVLPEDLFVVNAPSKDPNDKRLYVFEKEDFDEWVARWFARFGGFNQNDEQHVKLRTRLNSLAKPTTIDGSGRITIPLKQREKAELDKDVAVIGNTGYFEIWDAKRWDEQKMSDEDLASLLFG